jgi:hypothetical protein
MKNRDHDFEILVFFIGLETVFLVVVGKVLFWMARDMVG